MSRTLLGRALTAAQAHMERTGKPLGVILFSIDRFRLINHRFGYAVADKVLKRIQEVARSTIGRKGVVGRWGGDEFLCLLPTCGLREVAARARALDEAISGLVIPSEKSAINVTASFGTACAPEDGRSVQELMNAADEALYEAKNRGRNVTVAAGRLERRIFQMGALLETALREDRVVPAYQPIVDLADGRVVAEEALARIVTVDGEILAADEFIEAAEQFRLTHKIDWTVLLATLDRHRNEASGITRFVNISGDLLRHPHLLVELLASAKTHLDSGSHSLVKPLVIEVTERELLDNMELARARLAPFLEFGLQLALDDFGSGYSSFQYLADLPVSFLKIEGRLISRINESRVFSIVRSIQAVANDLGITTLAEYVETEEQVDLLRRIGVHWAQGHLFGCAVIDQSVAEYRRVMSVNWAQGYYYQKPMAPLVP